MDPKSTMILQAQQEVRDHTHDSLITPVLGVFDQVYEESVKKDGHIRTFQLLLKEVPAWSSLKVASICNQVRTSCDCLSELVSALFLSHIKILSSIKNAKMANVKVKIPKQEKFIHAVLIETARKFYENPIVFRKKDLATKEAYVMEAIETAVRKFLPLKDILSAYLRSKGTDVNSIADDPDHESVIQTPLNAPDDDDEEDEDEDEILDEEEEEEEEASVAPSEETKEFFPDPPPLLLSPKPPSVVASPAVTKAINITTKHEEQRPKEAAPAKKRLLFEDTDIVEDID